MNRRRALGLISGAAAGITVGVRPIKALGDVMKSTSLDENGEPASLSAARAVSGLRSGEFSAEEYARALIREFDRWRQLNVFISRDDDAFITAARAADRARSAGKALGPLHGLPVLLKDNIETAALPTTAATAGLRDYRPDTDAGVASALFSAGAILAGKANMHELAGGGPSDCEFGQVRNPYDPAMGAGGSSSGCAAALAARMVPAALGTDTGGSVRIPAALCGVVGLRPSLGRYPAEGIVPISVTRDTAGPMARNVADLALLDGAITGAATEVAPVSLSELRLGVPRAALYAGLDEASRPAVEGALTALAGAGVNLIEADIPALQTLAGNVRELLVGFEIGRDLPDYLASRGLDAARVIAQVCHSQLRAMLESRLKKDAMPEDAFQQELKTRRSALQAAYSAYFAEHRLDAILFPTTLLPARPIGQLEEVELNGQMVSTFIYNRNTSPGAAAGLPGLTLPAGLTAAGLPVALALDAPAGSDRTLLSIGAAAEAVMPDLPAP